jgi:Protein kinase domain
MADAHARHLDEDTVILLAQGALAGQALERAEAHLAQCGVCRSLLAESLHDAELALADPNARRDVEASQGSLPEGELEVPLPGTVLVDKYQVESVVGSGGMGVVLSAIHLMLGSRVAIKVLRRPGPSEIARFLREARVSAQLRNPHIARVFDFGQLPNGAPFLVMEYLEGRDLAKCIEQAALSVPVAVDYVLQACDALAQVHALGIVHRDLKPANLFLADDDQGRSIVKVLDFGIFKSIAGSALHVGLTSTQLTGQHALIGSPVYMSPEQMRADEVDARSDVWALGVILYELTTRALPFGERTFSALAMAVASEQPRPPAQLQPAISRDLEQVILRCLRKRPEERYRDAGELRAALLACREGQRPRARSWLALAVLAAALGAGLWWSTLQQAARSDAQPARGAALAPARDVAAPPDAAVEVVAPAPISAPPEVSNEPAPRNAVRRNKRPRPARPSTPRLGPTDTPD